MSIDSDARRARSLIVLQSADIPYNPHLPHIEAEQESSRRETREVVDRALAQRLIWQRSVHTHSLSPAELQAEDQSLWQTAGRWDLVEAFSPREKHFLDQLQPPSSEIGFFNSRVHAWITLLWALGLVSELGLPMSNEAHQRAHAELSTELYERGAKEFRQRARLRPQSELLDACDLAYLQFSLVMHLFTSGKEMHPQVDPQIANQRLYALNWLAQDKSWDEVTCDS